MTIFCANTMIYVNVFTDSTVKRIVETDKIKYGMDLLLL